MTDIHLKRTKQYASNTSLNGLQLIGSVTNGKNWEFWSNKFNIKNILGQPQMFFSGQGPGETFCQSEQAGTLTHFFSCLSIYSLTLNMIPRSLTFVLSFFTFP